jgi:hypothetical protein
MRARSLCAAVTLGLAGPALAHREVARRFL